MIYPLTHLHSVSVAIVTHQLHGNNTVKYIRLVWRTDNSDSHFASLYKLSTILYSSCGPIADRNVPFFLSLNLTVKYNSNDLLDEHKHTQQHCSHYGHIPLSDEVASLLFGYEEKQTTDRPGNR